MRQLILIVMAILCPFTNQVFGQFNDVNDAQVDNDDINSPMYRTGRLGIGFANYNAYNNIVGANPPRLVVREGILAHHVSDTIGLFSGKWCGLGIGNPGGGAGTPKP